MIDGFQACRMMQKGNHGRRCARATAGCARKSRRRLPW
jgi:hypothetical protein